MLRDTNYSGAHLWPHVKPAHVLIEPFKKAWTLEIAFTTEWDIEHTLGRSSAVGSSSSSTEVCGVNEERKARDGRDVNKR
jgi:hypothetical protein